MPIPKIISWEYLYEDPNYNRALNPERKPLSKLLPIGVKWIIENKIEFTKSYEAPISVAVFDGETQLLIVQPVNLSGNNNAVIYLSNGEVMRTLVNPMEAMCNSCFSQASRGANNVVSVLIDGLAVINETKVSVCKIYEVTHEGELINGCEYR